MFSNAGAPEPVTVDGLLAVPIDIQHLTATFQFDAASHACEVDATIEFIVGPTAGNPIFDLRQTIAAAWLDGASIDPTKLAHHDFGGGSDAELRVIEAVLAAGSSHTLRVTYELALPDAPNSSSGPPTYQWNGERLNLKFWYTDLRPGRYLDGWLPGNLIFDQFSAELDIEILNSGVSHFVMSNGNSVDTGPNHWQVSFPDHFTVCTSMLRIHPRDEIESRVGSTALPGGTVVEIHTHKVAGSTTNLANQEARIASMLGTNETAAGGYAYGTRFTAFFEGSGGMEYGGATKTSVDALEHEVYHSWWGRGMQPATQNDAWWDEGWTVFVTDGMAPVPLSFAEPPVELFSQNQWVRRTPVASYGSGSELFQGIASLIGDSSLRSMMREFYENHVNAIATTLELESFLICRSGEGSLVDAFHRFVYGFDDAVPNLWMRDDPSHAGAERWEGRFWDSPDLWIRNAEDDQTGHQNPVAGRDNWFYARVRNQGQAARHFVCTFNVKGFAGTQFFYPNDFLPCITATGGFELGPGESRVVKAKWPAVLVPPAGAHGCLLASAIARGDHPKLGRHVWEDNNLAQKNLTIVEAAPGDWILLPIVVGSRLTRRKSVILELVRPRGFSRMRAAVLPPVRPALEPIDEALIDCGGVDPSAKSIWSQRSMTSIFENYCSGTKEKLLEVRRAVSWRVTSKTGFPILLGLRLEVPQNAKPGSSLLVDVCQRDRWGRTEGGISVRMDVQKRGKRQKRPGRFKAHKVTAAEGDC